MSQLITLNLRSVFCRFAPFRIVRTSSTCARCSKRRSTCVGNIASIGQELNQFTHLNVSQRLRCSSTSVNKSNALDDVFPLWFVFVRTSVSFWMEFPEGVQFDVGYIDTKKQNNTYISDSKPVIIGLPSSAGDHTELTSILLTFAKLGYRVVIPNFPGSSFCRGKSSWDEAVFQMSVKEKAEFVADFLRELKIERVDMLLTNSDSVYTGVELCVINPSLFRSLVMINPTGLEPTKSMQPLWVHKSFTSVFDNRKILQGLLKACVAVVKMFTKKKHWKTISVVSYSRNNAALSLADESLRAEYMRNRAIPCYSIFGEDNDFLDVKSTAEYLSLLGIPESSITEINKESSIVKEGKPYNGNYGLHIQGDSDDIKKTRTVLLRKELIKILKKICPHH